MILLLSKKADLQVMIMIYKNDIFVSTSSKSSDYTSKKSNESKTWVDQQFIDETFLKFVFKANQK